MPSCRVRIIGNISRIRRVSGHKISYVFTGTETAITIFPAGEKLRLPVYLTRQPRLPCKTSGDRCLVPWVVSAGEDVAKARPPTNARRRSAP